MKQSVQKCTPQDVFNQTLGVIFKTIFYLYAACVQKNKS